MNLQVLINKKLYDKIKDAPNFMAALKIIDDNGVTFRLDIARKIITSIRIPDSKNIWSTTKHRERFGKDQPYVINITIPIYLEEQEVPDGQASI